MQSHRCQPEMSLQRTRIPHILGNINRIVKMGKIEPQEEPMGKRAARLGAGNTPLERPIKEEVLKVNNNKDGPEPTDGKAVETRPRNSRRINKKLTG